MSYLNIISLADAKIYLGVDDTSRDSEIIRIITAAFRYVENNTNYIVFAKDKTYQYSNYCVRVYDYPINSTANTTATPEVKNGYTLYTESNSETKSITLNVGFEDKEDIPEDIIEVTYMLIKHFFNEQEGSGKIPMIITEIINQNKRFII